MKKSFYATAVACFVLTAVFSQKGSSSSFSRNEDSRSGKRTVTIEINNDDSHLKVKCNGDIALNDSETAIASISPGGVLTYSKNGSRLVAESNTDGTISYGCATKTKN